MVNHQNVYNSVTQITEYILGSVSSEGSWGTTDYTDWGPIITVLNIEHLLKCGLSISEEWTIVKEDKTSHCSIEKCINYLSKIVRDDGSFGADFWDTCKLATLIVDNKLYDYFEYNKIHSYVMDFVTSGKLETQSTDYSQSAEWSGPGTYAACIQYLFLVGERNLANELLTKAIALQQKDGCFVGKKNKTGDNVIHPIWHTAQMLKVILKSSYGNDADKIDAIRHWMESVQGNNGEYDDFGQFVTYYTSYAALGFLELPTHPQPHTDLAIDFLLSKVRNGRVDDFGGTIMAVQVFDAYLGTNSVSSVYQSIQISHSKELLIENKELKEEIEDLSKIIEQYQEKYKDADIVISKKDAWKWGIWFGLITLVLGIIIPIIINVVLEIYVNSDIQNSITTITKGFCGMLIK